MAFSKKVGRVDTENVVGWFFQQCKQRTVRLGIALVDRNTVDKMTRSLEAGYVNAVNTMVQQLVYSSILKTLRCGLFLGQPVAISQAVL